MSWGQITSDSTTVRADAQINNRLPVGIGSSNVWVVLSVDFYDVPAAKLELPRAHLAKGLSFVEFQGTLEQRNFPEWWPEFIGNKEKLDIHVHPAVRMSLLGRSVTQSLPTISTQAEMPLLRDMHSNEAVRMGLRRPQIQQIPRILQDVGNLLQVGPTAPDIPILTLISWKLEWGEVSRDMTHILGTVVLQNESAFPIPIQGIRIALDMNNIPVVPDFHALPSQPQLSPHQTTTIKIDLTVSNQSLVEWWTSSLPRGDRDRGEQTTITVSIAPIIVLPEIQLLPQAGPLPAITLPRQTIPLPLLAVPGFNCEVETDILGVANYRIAEKLETDPGTLPEPSVKCSAFGRKLLQLGETVLEPTPTSSRPTPGVPPGPQVPYTLTASVAGSNTGQVLIAPPGGPYKAGTSVVMTAVPFPPYVFDRWEGDASGTFPVLTVTMDRDKRVTAHFKGVFVLPTATPVPATVAPVAPPSLIEIRIAVTSLLPPPGRFEFEPSIITLKAGRSYTISFSSSHPLPHTFTVDTLEIDLLAPPPGTPVVSKVFTANQLGTYLCYDKLSRTRCTIKVEP